MRSTWDYVHLAMSSQGSFSRPVSPSEHFIISPTIENHTGTVIFLHGMGQRVQDWAPFIHTLAARLPGLKWILPQAPSSPVTMKEGRRRLSWFDIFHMPPCPSCGAPGSSESVTRIEQIILAEMHAIARPKRVVVVGFSQGAALGIVLALTSLHDLGGVASLSGWIPRRCRQQMAQFEPNLPVFWGHGTADAEIPINMAEECVGFLRQSLRFPEQRVTFKSYDGLAHAISEQETSDLAEWLASILS